MLDCQAHLWGASSPLHPDKEACGRQALRGEGDGRGGVSCCHSDLSASRRERKPAPVITISHPAPLSQGAAFRAHAAGAKAAAAAEPDTEHRRLVPWKAFLCALKAGRAPAPLPRLSQLVLGRSHKPGRVQHPPRWRSRLPQSAQSQAGAPGRGYLAAPLGARRHLVGHGEAQEAGQGGPWFCRPLLRFSRSKEDLGSDQVPGQGEA